MRVGVKGLTRDEPTIQLSELNTRKTYDRVTNMTKGNEQPPVSISGGLTKQELVLFGTTGIVTLTPLERDVDYLTDDLS